MTQDWQAVTGHSFLANQMANKRYLPFICQNSLVAVKIITVLTELLTS